MVCTWSSGQFETRNDSFDFEFPSLCICIRFQHFCSRQMNILTYAGNVNVEGVVMVFIVVTAVLSGHFFFHLVQIQFISAVLCPVWGLACRVPAGIPIRRVWGGCVPV